MESAYSEGGLFLTEKADVLENEKTMKEMSSLDNVYVGLFHAGSSAEGLALQGTWGHDPTDEDEMLLFGQHLGVHIPQGSQLAAECLLVYRPEDCPPGYCKLKVSDTQALEQTSVWGQQLGASCIQTSGNQHWLHTQNTLSRIQQAKRAVTPDPVYKFTALSGPSGQAASGLVEYVPTLVGNMSYPYMEEYRCRKRRDWPSAQLIDELSRLQMLFVLVGYKYGRCSDFNIQARQSWSHCEFKLISSLPKHIIQGYIAFKYIMKTLLASRRNQTEIKDGRSQIGSYHLKNVLLHHLEKQPPSLIKSPFALILNLCRDLSYNIKNETLPNYFLAECNLLETVDPADMCLTQEVIRYILSDPLHALLMSHTRPREIYGDIRPSEFMAAFRQLSHKPTSRENQQHLLEFLEQIDMRRDLHHVLQQLGDKFNPKNTGRKKPVGLVSSLKKIIGNRR